jgi:hypothetical protein
MFKNAFPSQKFNTLHLIGVLGIFGINQKSQYQLVFLYFIATITVCCGVHILFRSFFF